MYFIRKESKMTGEIEPNSPFPDQISKEGYIKFKNYK